MTEYSSQPDPAEPLKGILSDHALLIQSHDFTLRSVAEQHRQTNQQLEQVTAMLQLSLNKTPTQPLEAAVANPETQRLPFAHDVISPSPEKYSDETLKDELVFVDESESLEEFIAKAIRIDNRLRERRRPRNERSSVRVQPLVFSTINPKSPSPEPAGETEPMQVSF
ncbi:hypothetical protein AMECASPLE_009115 [Ameca splendens]|uniref:Uncharacterized protein n=1 Tax=Ameca splendens TaxID=208324 RepID=A0ABV0ZW35_9TELE